MQKVVGMIAVLMLVAPGTALAQGWDYRLTPYLWASGIDGALSAGPIGADLSMDFSDIVDILRGGALVRFEAQSDRHGVFGDVVYLRLKEKDARDTIGGTLEVKLDTMIVEGAYYYRWSDTFGLELGARFWDMETTLRPAVLPEVVGTSDWVDGFIGFRTDREINRNWSWLFRGNVGVGGSDFAAGLQLDFHRRFDSGNALTVGLRILDVERSDSSGAVPVDVDLSLSGLAVGYSFDL